MAHDPRLLGMLQSMFDAGKRQGMSLSVALEYGEEPERTSGEAFTVALDTIEADWCVVVPVEPTHEMNRAAVKIKMELSADGYATMGHLYIEGARDAYVAMVAARPGAQP